MSDKRPWHVKRLDVSLWTGREAWYATAEEALAVWNQLPAASTNAVCGVPGCQAPALVPDGYCKRHALECAFDRIVDHEHYVVAEESSSSDEKRKLLRDILSLGLREADLMPDGQEEQRG